jgi:hypothetical protein
MNQHQKNQQSVTLENKSYGVEYIFDFDHTLFDTPLFSFEATAYKSDGLYVTPQIWNILDAQKYIYNDVYDFLLRVGPSTVKILTAMTPELGPQSREFQKAKLARSGISEYVSDIIFMEGAKGLFVKEMYTGEPTIFIDDKLEQLLSVKASCPEVFTVQIVRPDLKNTIIASTQADIPVVTSLAELSDLLNHRYGRN